jgi:hypothetical protein
MIIVRGLVSHLQKRLILLASFNTPFDLSDSDGDFSLGERQAVLQLFDGSLLCSDLLQELSLES